MAAGQAVGCKVTANDFKVSSHSCQASDCGAQNCWITFIRSALLATGILSSPNTILIASAASSLEENIFGSCWGATTAWFCSAIWGNILCAFSS